jgi:curved DNA-binding protein
MEYKDYYKILGVDKGATQADIKKAYRKLAVKYHPDKTKGDKALEDRFKEVAEAYEVLHDPEKRKKYDELGANWKQYQQAGYEGFGQGRGSRGQRYEYRGDPSEFFGGAGGFSDFFESFFGGGSRFGNGFGFQQHAPGADRTGEVPISLEEAYHGTHRIIDLGGEKIKVPIKPGAYEGLKIRVRGKGEPGMSGQPGHLYLTIRLLPHAQFERKGDDLYVKESIDLFTALLGGRHTVATPSGSVIITVPEGTSTGKQFRLRGKGMPHYGKTGHGDLYVTAEVSMPRHLNEQQKELVRQLKKSMEQTQA